MADAQKTDVVTGSHAVQAWAQARKQPPETRVDALQHALRKKHPTAVLARMPTSAQIVKVILNQLSDA